jgi:hypothetical protein
VTLGAFSPEAASPWLQLLLYAAAGSGPRSLALVRGQRLSKLPPALAEGAAGALLWPWDASAAAADPALAALLGSGGSGGGGNGSDASLAAALAEAGAEEEEEDGGGGGGGSAAAAAGGVAAALVGGGGEAAVLAALNRMLTRTAVLAQPWGAEEGWGQAADIPLPLESPPASCCSFAAVACSPSAARVDVSLPAAVPAALRRLGLDTAVGFLRVVQRSKSQGSDWVPLSVSLGVPLYRPALCREVCRRAAASAFLSPARVAAQAAAQRRLQRALAAMAARFGAAPGGAIPPAAAGRDDAAGTAAPVDLPACCLAFDGAQLMVGGSGAGLALAAGSGRGRRAPSAPSTAAPPLHAGSGGAQDVG